MKVKGVDNKFLISKKSKQAAHYRNQYICDNLYFFNTQILLVKLERICLGDLRWSRRTVN